MRPCPKCGHPMESGRPYFYCGKCGYNERFGPPAGTELAKTDVRASNRFDDLDGSDTPNSELTEAARNALRGNWGVAIGTFLLYAIIISVISSIPLLGALAIFVVHGPFLLGIAIFYLNLSRGTRREVELIFKGFSRFGLAFSAYWLMGIFVFLWSLLLIIPGIIMSFAYAMTFFVIADDESVSAMAAIRRSQEMMRGNKFKLFLMMCRFIGWTILSLLTFGIGFLWLVPYIAVSVAKFYDDVKGR
jgi:uncharacterized membrane protein